MGASFPCIVNNNWHSLRVTRTRFDSAVATPWRTGKALVTGWWIVDRMTDKPGERSSHPMMDPFFIRSYPSPPPPVCVASVHATGPNRRAYTLHIFSITISADYGFISIIVPRWQLSRPWKRYNSIAPPSRWIIIALRYSNDTIAAPSIFLILD